MARGARVFERRAPQLPCWSLESEPCEISRGPHAPTLDSLANCEHLDSTAHHHLAWFASSAKSTASSSLEGVALL